MERVSVDRFEDNLAVCVKDDLTIIVVERDVLPEGSKPGSVLTIGDDGTIKIDKNEELIRRKRIMELYNAVIKDEE